MGAADRGEVEAHKELLCEHVHLEKEAHFHAVKLAPMHIVAWGKPRRKMLCWLPARDGFMLTKTPNSKKKCIAEEIFG